MVATEESARLLRDYISTNITRLAVGANKAASVPATSDTSLDYEVTRLTVSSTDTSTDREVTFQHVVDVDSANGFALKEVGLGAAAVTTLEDGEDVSDWTAGGDAAVTADATIFQIGTKSMKIALTFSTGTGTVTKTTSIGDVSAITGVSSGTPVRGAFSSKIYVNSLANVTSITYRIGSDSSNYASKAVTLGSLTEDTWAGFNFSLSGATITGTPVWTAVDYQHIIVVCTADCDVYFDDMFLTQSIATRNSVPTINKTSLLEVIYETTVTVTPQ